MAKQSAKSPGRAKPAHRRHHHRRPAVSEQDRLPDRDDAAESVEDSADAVSEAAGGHRHRHREDVSDILREAADAVADAEAALAEIGDGLNDAATISEKAICEALATQERAIIQAAKAQEAAIAAAQDAIARAMAAALDASDRPHYGGVQPLPSDRRFGD